MITCRCIKKFRDRNGVIKGYRLQDNQGTCLDVKPDQLKMAIFSKQLDVINLKLTTDSRLIDKQEESDKNIANAFKPSSDEKILEQLLELIKNNTYGDRYYNEDLGDLEWEHNEDISKAIKLFEMLGVKIEKLEIPSKKYIGFNNVCTRFYCGMAKIQFCKDVGMLILIDGESYYINSISELNYIVNKLKSKQNTSCTTYGQVHKMCTTAIMRKIIKDESFKKYCICFSWNDNHIDDIYCVPINLDCKDIDEFEFSNIHVPILFSIVMPEKENGPYRVILTIYDKEETEFLIDTHGNLNRTYREIQTITKDITNNCLSEIFRKLKTQ